jgi:type II secretory pathway pseudopilin PulG
VTSRDRSVLIAVLAVAALVGAWILVVAPKRGTASKLSTSIQAVQAQLATIETQVAADRQARAAFPVQYAQLARLGEAVPQDDNIPSLIYELQTTAKASGVDFRGLQLTPGSGSTPGPSASAGASAALPPGVSAGAAGFATEQFTFSFSGEFFNLSDFLGRLDRFVVASGSTIRVSGRLMTLNALTLGPGSLGFPEMLANVSATTYLLPSSQGALGSSPSTNPGAPRAGPSTGLPGGSPSSPGLTSSPGSGTAGSSGSSPAPAATIFNPALSGGIR